MIWYKNLDGAGTLSAATPTVIASQVIFMKPMDVDSDGDTDIVFSDFYRTKWAENTNGQGTAWSAPKELDDDQEATAAAMADIDGDGLKDLVMTLFGPGLVWFKRTPTGFSPLKYLLSGVVSKTGYDQFLCVGDPDQDGDADVVGSSPGKLIFYRNNGTGVFQHTIMDTPENVNGLAFTDVDGDGDDDLAATNRDPEKVLWYANTSGAVFGPARLISADYNYIGDLALADLDLDGDPDLITANGNSGTIDSVIQQLLWYENQGGHFTRQHVLAFDWADFSRIQVADFDGDNDPDILAASAKPFNISWFENDGTGRFDVVHTLASSVGGGVPPDILATDVDADGDSDVVFATIGGFGKVSWFQNLDGAGTFSPV
ncbi:MAG: VCBS repeat-containing protein, partial [Verrucomicrobia subdivision 3 bacterium]|nr:VCBS repeat-containing protein [Limisphaerales bacterium]